MLNLLFTAALLFVPQDSLRTEISVKTEKPSDPPAEFVVRDSAHRPIDTGMTPLTFARYLKKGDFVSVCAVQPSLWVQVTMKTDSGSVDATAHCLRVSIGGIQGIPDPSLPRKPR